MARIRSIHPGIFTNESYASLSIYARELLKGVWCEAWDDGVFEWRPLRLKMRIFPLDAVDVEALLAELVNAKFIVPLEVAGNEYAVIHAFRKWQRPKKPMASGVLPAHLHSYIGLKAGETPGKAGGKDERVGEALGAEEMPEDEGEDDAPDNTGNAPAPHQFPTGTELCQQKGGREEGRKVLEGSLRSPSPREGATGTPAAPGGESPLGAQGDDGGGFEAFWAAYPPGARTAPDYARRAYAKAIRLGATPGGILAALQRDLDRPGRRDMLPPAAWLKGGSWRPETHAEAPKTCAVTAAPPDGRFEGWEIGDHMELRKWQKARENGWRALGYAQATADERREALWDHLLSYRPLVVRFLAAHEPEGIPAEAARAA